VRGSRIDVSKHATWLDRIERFKTSGLAQATFCRQEGVPVKRFVYWYRRYREGKLQPAANGKKKSSKESPVMLPVTVASAPRTSGKIMEVYLVRMPADASEEMLRQVFACLSRTSC
jgi:hypothetical protein